MACKSLAYLSPYWNINPYYTGGTQEILVEWMGPGVPFPWFHLQLLVQRRGPGHNFLKSLLMIKSRTTLIKHWYSQRFFLKWHLSFAIELSKGKSIYLSTSYPANSKRRHMLSPMIVDLRWPTCISLAMLGEEKSTTTWNKK